MWNQWFLFPKAYEKAIEMGKDGDNFLEIGAFEGASTSHMCKLIRDSGKKINFFVVDTWSTKFQGGGVDQVVDRYENDNFFCVFQKNLEKQDLFQYVKPMQMTSREAYDYLKHLKFKFIFLDGDHSYENVSWELSVYPSLLTDDGVIGGDDYPCPDVKRAVTERFPENVWFSEDFYSAWMKNKV